MTTSMDKSQTNYKPTPIHWFYKRPDGFNDLWLPLSHTDSKFLETNFAMGSKTPTIVPVEGGRYDLNITERSMTPIFWDHLPFEVRRCSWFYKVEAKYIPYEETTAMLLEMEYQKAMESGVWQKKIDVGKKVQVALKGPNQILHTEAISKTYAVKRGLEDVVIESGEPKRVDHLLFFVLGIGDEWMQSIDKFRRKAQQFVQSRFKSYFEKDLVGRIEVLPITWHRHLPEFGVDTKLRSIALESVSKLRNYTTDTLLNVLYYTSPMYCQRIMNMVSSSLNAAYLKYRKRNPSFSGEVSVAGHCLGAVVLFDLLCHQSATRLTNIKSMDQLLLITETEKRALERKSTADTDRISYTMGASGIGQPSIQYGQLLFGLKKFFALGSPIGIFVTLRGTDKIGFDFHFPTCDGFYNIFHPYDPVAYRIEGLINPKLSDTRPVAIPSHKGNKHLHLELRDSMKRVGSDIKQRLVDVFKPNKKKVNFQTDTESTKNRSSEESKLEDDASDGLVGKLNNSKRIDYVLQESPLEMINEYLFAISSHKCYWESSDTILFIIKEIYMELGFNPDDNASGENVANSQQPSGSHKTQ